jgi:hypothetical protein
MPGRKVKLNLPNIGLVEGTEVQVLESVDRWSEIKLEDGTVLRIKPVPMSVARIDGRYDAEGNPMYAVQAQQVMSVTAPEQLRQIPQAIKGVQ